MFHIAKTNCFVCTTVERLNNRYGSYTLKDLHEVTLDRFWCCRAVCGTYKKWGRMYYNIDPESNFRRQWFVCNDCHRQLELLRSLDWLRASSGSLP